MAEKKEPFVQAEDRPEPPDPNKPVTELRVRELSVLLQQALTLKSLKQEIDVKHLKFEKFEHPKWEKFEKWEHPKWEKLEKFEKYEKLEFEPIPKGGFEPGPDPTRQIDPRIDQLIAVVSGLTQQVQQIAKDVAELKSRGAGAQ
jgi:hypothetical protein